MTEDHEDTMRHLRAVNVEGEYEGARNRIAGLLFPPLNEMRATHCIAGMALLLTDLIMNAADDGHQHEKLGQVFELMGQRACQHIAARK